MTLRDLFDGNGAEIPPATKRSRGKGWPTADAAADYWLSRIRQEHDPTWKLVATFTYSPTFRVLRFEPADRGPDRLKELRPIHGGDDGRWRSGDPPSPLPLYGAVGLADEAAPVYVTEGEAKVDRLRELGLCAVSASHGAKSAAKSDWSPLAGRTVYLLGDYDEPGKRYAADVAAILHGLNPPAAVRVVELPGLPEHGDIVDLVDSQREDAKDDQAIAHYVEDLAAAAPEWEPPALTATPECDSLTEADAKAIVTRAANSWRTTTQGWAETALIVREFFDRDCPRVLPVAYLAAALDLSRSFVYRLLDAGRAIWQLQASGEVQRLRLSQHAVEALRPLVDQPGELRAAVQDAASAAEHEGKRVRRRHVVAAVRRRLLEAAPTIVDTDGGGTVHIVDTHAATWWPTFVRCLDATRAVPDVPADVLSLLEQAHKLALFKNAPLLNVGDESSLVGGKSSPGLWEAGVSGRDSARGPPGSAVSRPGGGPAGTVSPGEGAP
jgi:hypothetical protein